jgi:hydroxylysine kinase
VNETNVLINYDKSSNSYHVSGLLDFGDTHYSLLIHDIAAAILYLLLDVKTTEYGEEWFRIGEQLIEGYRSLREPRDLAFVGLCMRARLVSSLVYGLRTARLNYRKGDVDYILKTQSNGWKVLEILSRTDLTQFHLSYS